jgi:S-adenosylmethionine:tRNA ribosyltransferase-isomerase
MPVISILRRLIEKEAPLQTMNIEDFNYHLPQSLIAQYPSSQRDESRLMVVHRADGRIDHRIFRNLPEYLAPGDLLIMNNSRVIPARLLGRKETGGRCEVLVLSSGESEQGEVEALLKGSRRWKEGMRIDFGQGIVAEIKALQGGRARLSFSYHGKVSELLWKRGRVPLPPYIKRQDEPGDRERYQTVYAEKDGSIAAPTAGLHFSQELIKSLQDQGVEIALLTLHIGVGTFKPVKTERIEDHRMEAEWIEISEEIQRKIEQTRKKGKRVIAVGTTTTRALESFADQDGRVRAGRGFSSLFIYPPFRFRVVDALVTNFHLPKSTLIMLVSAFAGRELIMKAYQEAIERRYRFYSYGDAMLIL